MKDKKTFLIRMKVLLLFFMLCVLSVAAQSKISNDTVVKKQAKQPVYFVNNLYVDADDFEGLLVPEDIDSITVVKNADSDPEMEKLFQKYGENTGFIFVYLKPGKSILNLIGPDGKRLESERLPVFPGGKEAMSDYIATNKRYPADLRKAGIKGSVYVAFVVQEDGSLSDIKVKKGVDTALDSEAVRLVREMPKWIPGKKGGKLSDYEQEIHVNFGVVYIR